MSGSQGEEGQSIYRLRWIGYGLLVLALIDAIQVLIPPAAGAAGNPEWVLQTIGALVERVPVPLLGLALVFFGEDMDRTGLEKTLLSLLSWVSLLLAVISLLLIPPGLAYTVQINNQNNQQIATQAAGQLKQLQEVETQVSQGTPQDIQNLVSQLSSLGLKVDSQKPEEVRSQILEKIATAKKDIEPQAKAARSNLRTALLKNSVKWNLGALISSALFFTIWRSTGWTRRRRGY